MKPVAAISGPGMLALALTYDATPEPCAAVLVQDVHAWVDAPLLLRLQHLVACLPTSRIEGDSGESHLPVPLHIFASSCSLSYCFSSTSAVSLAIAPGTALTRLFAEFDKPAFRAEGAPFCSMQGNSISMNWNQTRVLHVRERSPSTHTFDLMDVAVASDLQISALFSSIVDLPDFCRALPGALAAAAQVDAPGKCWMEFRR